MCFTCGFCDIAAALHLEGIPKTPLIIPLSLHESRVPETWGNLYGIDPASEIVSNMEYDTRNIF